MSEEITKNIEWENDPLYKKYGSVEALIEAHRNLQTKNFDLSKSNTPPDEYRLPADIESLEEKVKERLLATAKEGKLTQTQFDVLARKINDDRKEISTKLSQEQRARQEAIGDESEVEKLRTFYKNRLPEGVFDQILKYGSEKEIKELKTFRDLNLNHKAPQGDGVSTMDTYARSEAIQKKRDELIALQAKRRRADVREQNAIEKQTWQLAKEIAELKAEMPEPNFII